MEKQMTWDFADEKETELHFVRIGDKGTSQVAAVEAKPKLNGWRAEFMARLERIGKPSTANEVAQGNESIRKRALELVRSGVIQELSARECNVSGKLATVYWLKDD